MALSFWRRRKGLDYTQSTVERERSEHREDMLRRAERELVSAALLAEVAWTAAGSLTLRQICAQVLQDIRGELCGLRAGSIYVVEDKGRTLHQLALLGYPRKIASAINRLPVSDSSSVGLVALHHLELLTDETYAEPPESYQRRRLMGLQDTRWLALPIERQGKLEHSGKMVRANVIASHTITVLGMAHHPKQQVTAG
jgi:hypothetical protein